jgi:hypothetical protein
VAFISSAFTAGQTLTAASMEALRENSNAGHNVFTNEAARDAAITAPTEGMMAYLTAPTAPAATGATYSTVPTGVTTIYNGSTWVCVTPVTAKSNTSGTTTSTAYVTTLTSDTTAVSVTLVTGTTALVIMSAQAVNTAGGNNDYVSVSVSGATTVAAADTASATATHGGANYGQSLNRVQVISGLTAGTNTFTLNYRVNAGTGTFAFKDLTVQGIA